MSLHPEPHPLASETVTINLRDANDPVPGFEVEDWWDRVNDGGKSGGSWMAADGNPACLIYAIRSGKAGLPMDNEVIYGHTADGLGHLIHDSEIVR